MEKKRIKILYVHHGHSRGGAPRSLSFLINQLDKSLYEPYVVCCADILRNRMLFEAVGANVINGKYMGAWHGSTVTGMSLKVLKYNLIHALPTYIGMSKIMKLIQPDIVHLNSTCLFIAAKAVKHYNNKIPVVCHIREPLLQNKWGNILMSSNEKVIDHYISIDRYDATSLNNTKVPISIIYNFVDFRLYNDKVKSDCLRKELSINMEDTILLYLARVIKQNGTLDMLIALEPLLKKKKNIHLCIVGIEEDSNDEYQKKVQIIARKYCNVHVLHFRNDIPNVIASSNVMLVPFQQPHFARSIIEAGAMGVPCIASDIGGLQELVVDGITGILFDHQSFKGFADACMKLSTDIHLRKMMGQESKKYAHKNFNAIENARYTFEVYEDLLKFHFV